jgi:aspartate racemase
VRALGLIGTSSVADVYARTGCDLVVPAAARQRRLDELILGELSTRPADERDLPVLAGQVAELAARGAEAVVLACTDFGSIAGQLDAEVPVLDSTSLHVAAALTLTARDAV